MPRRTLRVRNDTGAALSVASYGRIRYAPSFAASPMRITIRRLLLLLCAVRYGARLLWTAAPRHGKVHWIATLLGPLHDAPNARAALRRALPQLGPLASAFADALATDPGAAGRTLHDLLDALGRAETALTKPLTAPQREAALHEALGRPPEDVFAWIEPAPLENGIAEQVHAARLRSEQNGHIDVTVKMLRVRQVQHIEDDLAVLRWLARLVERSFPAARTLELPRLVESFSAELRHRFDLRSEAANLSQTGRCFAGDSRVVVPAVVWNLSTDHALVVQRIETLPVTALDGLRQRGVNLERLAVHLVEVTVDEAFEHGFFRAALAAQRMRVSVEAQTLGSLVLADCAVMSSLAEPQRAFFVHGARALFEQDYGRLAGMHHEAGHVTPGTRPEMLEAELRARSEAHFARPTAQRTASALLHHLIEVVQPFGGAVPPALVLARHSLARAESLARTLSPQVDTWRVVEASFAELARKDLDHRGWIKRLSHELPHLAPIVPRLPLLFLKRLYWLHQRRDSFDAAALLRDLRLEQQRTRRLLWACVIVGTLLGAAMTWLAR